MSMKNNNLVVLTALAVVFSANYVFAQAPGEKSPGSQVTTATIDPDSIKRLEAIQARYNAQILQAFQGNEALKAAMESELKAISEIRDGARRSIRIREYQRKYDSDYSRVLRAGKVDIAAAAREMSAVGSGLRFSVIDAVRLKIDFLPTNM